MQASSEHRRAPILTGFRLPDGLIHTTIITDRDEQTDYAEHTEGDRHFVRITPIKAGQILTASEVELAS